jgi:hypothetical protein
MSKNIFCFFESEKPEGKFIYNAGIYYRLAVKFWNEKNHVSLWNN